jgi:negative regulator of flagellin synthesis FlgM
MRIDGTNPWSSVEAVNSVPPENNMPKGQIQSGDEGTDDAQLSPDAALASSLHAKLAQVPEVRQEKVGQLRQSVNEGTYTVSSEQIASAMLNDIQGLICG